MKTKVKYFRFIRGEMTQSDLGSKVSVSRQTIAAIERGNYSPSVWLAIKLAKVLETSVEELFNPREN
jgi:putative transcriptional regulator